MVANLTIQLAIISCLFISKAVPSLPISLIGNRCRLSDLCGDWILDVERLINRRMLTNTLRPYYLSFVGMGMTMVLDRLMSPMGAEILSYRYPDTHPPVSIGNYTHTLAVRDAICTPHSSCITNEQ